MPLESISECLVCTLRATNLDSILLCDSLAIV